MSKSLFLFTVNPVQPFIEQARKTQDLYSASYILSHLCRVSMREAQTYNAEILFPSLENQSIPNRFFAVVPETEHLYLEKIGLAVERKARSEFLNIACTVMNSFQLEAKPSFIKQIEQYFQFFWVFTPYDEKQYASCYKRAEQELGAAKTIRTFRQFEQAPGRKCSLTGSYNALVFRKDTRKFDLAEDAILVNEVQVPLKFLGKTEALGAVAFTKRAAEKYFAANYHDYKGSFPSTADIAIMDAISEVEKKEKRKVNCPEAQVVLALKSGSGMPEDVSEQDRYSANQLYGLMEEHNINFSAYYAILLYDGDDMGEWLSGTKLRPEVSWREFHISLSRQLAQFAAKAREEFLVRPKGGTVYAGGDDFLGFVNLKHLFTVIKNLREAFSKEIDLSVFTDEQLTFSAGIAIAHCKTPLREVLKWARLMAREAKNVPNKDAFGIAVVKHSGEIHKTVYKWKHGDVWTVDDFARIVEALRAGAYSDNFIQTLQREILSLTDFNDTEINLNIVKTEICRLLNRAKSNPEVIAEHPRGRIADSVYRLCVESLNNRTIGNFLDALNITRFMEREAK